MVRADRALDATSDSGPPAPLRGRLDVWTPVLVVLTVLLMSLILLVQARALGAGWSSFVFAGERMTDATQLPAEITVTSPDLGYDGQYVYRLALDPLTDRQTDQGVTLDNPAYRQQRILLPGLAWGLGRVTSVSPLIWIPVLNVAAGVLLVLSAGFLLRRYGAPRSLALLVSLSAPVIIGTSRDLNEPLALGLAVAALAALTAERSVAVGLLCCASVMAKETTLVVPAAIGLIAVVRWISGDRRAANYAAGAGALAAGVLYLGWHTWLAGHWDVADPQSASEHLAMPGVGAMRSLVSMNVSQGRAPAVQETVWLAGRWVLLVMLVLTALVLRRSVVILEAKVAWLLGAILGLSVPGWLWGAQFTRASGEAIVLGTLILATCPGRWRWACLTPGILAFLTIQAG